MTALEFLACLVAGAFIGVGALGLAYGIFAIAATTCEAIRPSRAVKVNLVASVQQYANRLNEAGAAATSTP
jgi:hypothetical protein